MNELETIENSLFEKQSHQNGMTYWWASDFVLMLGYAEYHKSMSPIQKAISVCTSTGIDIQENIFLQKREIDGKQITDYKLSRFGCYLVAMNSDIKKPKVAHFQTYFSSFVTAIQDYVCQTEDIERVSLRTEISEQEKNLNATAKMQGIENYAFFQNKGYIGLYNLSLNQIKELKNIPQNKTPFDYMDSEELGANIFRITQTDAKIKRENITGQKPLENAAFEVGKVVRNAIAQAGGTMPENIPPKNDIRKIKSNL